MSVTSPVETLAESQTAEELVRLVTEPAHAGAVEQVQALGEGGTSTRSVTRRAAVILKVSLSEENIIRF